MAAGASLELSFPRLVFLCGALSSVRPGAGGCVRAVRVFTSVLCVSEEERGTRAPMVSDGSIGRGVTGSWK